MDIQRVVIGEYFGKVDADSDFLNSLKLVYNNCIGKKIGIALCVAMNYLPV